MTTWGPHGRRAAVTVTFELPGHVSPALPTLLRILADHELSATFFVDAAVAEAEPLALTMLAAGRNEIGALAEPGELPLRYASVPAEAILVEDGVVRIPVDGRLREAAHEHPGAWHEALQVAIGRAVERGAGKVMARWARPESTAQRNQAARRRRDVRHRQLTGRPSGETVHRSPVRSAWPVAVRRARQQANRRATRSRRSRRDPIRAWSPGSVAAAPLGNELMLHRRNAPYE